MSIFTKKSVAIAASVSMGLVGLVAAPANSAGVDGTAQLKPTNGYENGFAVPATAAATFGLTFTTTDTSGGTIKFKVEDPTGKIEPSGSSAGRTLITIDGDADKLSVDVSEKTVGIRDVSTDISGLVAGDVVSFASDVKADLDADSTVQADEVLIAANAHVEVTDVTGKQITLSVPDMTAAVVAEGDFGTPAGTFDGAVNLATDADYIMRVSREKRASDNSYIIDTGVTTNSAQTAAIILTNEDGASATRSADVFGWVDLSTLLNDKVDSIESTSSTEKVQFVKVDEITASVALTTPVVGDQTLAATVTTTPVLNGAQIDNNTSAIGQSAAADFIRVAFTRQDSNVVMASDSATQDTDDGTWDATVSMDDAATEASWSSSTKKLTQVTATIWGFTAPTDRAPGDIGKVEITAAKVATITTDANHNLRTGDKVTVQDDDGAGDSSDTNLAAAFETAATVTVTSATTFTYPLTETGDVTAASIADAVDTEYAVVTHGTDGLVERVFAGSHSAQVLINTKDDDTDADEEYTLTGDAVALGTLAAATDDVRLTTSASASVQGSSTTADDATRDAYVLAGTDSIDVVATLLDKDGDALGAGRAVEFTVTRSSATTLVNGQKAAGVATTDENGQAVLTVTDSLGLDGTTVTIDVTGENAASSDITLEWDKQTFSLYDLNVSNSAALGASATRLVEEGSSYTLDLLYADQWVTGAPAGDYRLSVSGSGVTEGFVDIVDGKASVVISDSGVSDSFTSTLTIQKKNDAGVFKNTTTTTTVTTNTTDKAKVTLAADAAALYSSATVTDLSDAVAAKALVERDTRTDDLVQPVYTNAVTITGKATNSSTGANLANAVITLEGPNNILFSFEAVDNRGSITLVSDSNGEFAVNLYSTSNQTDSVVTVTSAGASATTKVSFTGKGVGEGTVLTIDTPASVAAAGTFQVKANLADAYGNGVDTTAGRMKVTYTGAGIYFGTLPTETDASGNLAFSVLLGANDTGTITVTVQYDQNGDADFVDAKDLTTTKTITVGATASADAKVNAGSFKGYVAVYAKGYEGQRLSAKIGNDWVIVPSLASNFERVVDFTGAGVDIAVRIYIDRVLMDTINLTTK